MKPGIYRITPPVGAIAPRGIVEVIQDERGFATILIDKEKRWPIYDLPIGTKVEPITNPLEKPPFDRTVVKVSLQAKKLGSRRAALMATKVNLLLELASLDKRIAFEVSRIFPKSAFRTPKSK